MSGYPALPRFEGFSGFSRNREIHMETPPDISGTTVIFRNDLAVSSFLSYGLAACPQKT
jgi:hypothetical protein